MVNSCVRLRFMSNPTSRSEFSIGYQHRIGKRPDLSR
jgi:hypothetical protein